MRWYIIEDTEIKTSNVQAEICFVGSLYKNTDLYVTYGSFIRSKYDFSDEAVKFFYDSFEVYYMTFSQTVDEVKMNTFMSQNEERLKIYRQYKGWKTIKQYMNLSDDSDCKNYYSIIKKYSLVREYGRNGFPIDKIVNHKKFDTMDANDIYRIIRTKADKIHTIINAGEEAVELTKNNSDLIDSYLDKPDFGLPFPWAMYNEHFLGMRETKTLFEGFLSNSGKTRKLMVLAAWVSLVQHERFLFLSNEMDEKDLRNCLITTVINNKEFQEMHGVKINKCEKEIVLGVYRDNNGDIIRRKIDDTGTPIETNKEFKQRVLETSDEYHKIKKVTEWIDNNNQGKLLFKDIGEDYSIQRIEFELRKAKVIYNVKYYGYDTLKCYGEENWATLKQDATKLKELTKELKVFGFAVFQLTDDTVYTDIFELSSNNISSSKGIKHVVDHLTIGKRLDKSIYHKYQYISENDSWGEPVASELDLSKQYFAIKIDKNRSGSKDKIMLFEINLDYNTWVNIGYLIKKTKE